MGGWSLRFSITAKTLRILAAGASAAACALALAWWVLSAPRPVLAPELPGEDGAPRGRPSAARPGAAAGSPPAVTTTFRKLAEMRQPALSGAWPGFRGPARDNIVRDSPDLTDLSGDPPPVLWRIAVGEGHAGAAVYEGRVYLLDYLEEEKADALRCFSLGDGTELWRRSYPVTLKRNHGFSRTVPAVAGRFVVTLGPTGVAMCADRLTGDLVWVRPLFELYGAKPPPWYTGQCPLIDDGQAVFAPAGSALVIGVELSTGKVLWETPNADGWLPSHSSVMKYTIDGRPVYLYAAVGGVAAVSAGAGDRGRLVWKSADWNVQVSAPSPLLMPGDQVLLTAGYGAGSMVMRVKDGKAVTLFARPPGESGMASEQQTPILFQGMLFGILPKDAGELHNQLACMTPAGSLVWSSGKTDRYGLGPYLVADGKIFILDDDGTLYAVRASTSGYRRLGSAPLMAGRGVDAWGPMALAGTRLLLRDSTRLFCVDLAAGQ